MTRSVSRRGFQPTMRLENTSRLIRGGVVVASMDEQRQRQNLEIEGFELIADKVAGISALGRSDGRLWNGDHDTTGFM